MQTTVENTEKHTVKLTIEVPPEQVDKDLDRTYRTTISEPTCMALTVLLLALSSRRRAW